MSGAAEIAGDHPADYAELGTTHMLGGYDHLLFIGGITLLYDRLPDVLKAVTLFTAGHTAT